MRRHIRLLLTLALLTAVTHRTVARSLDVDRLLDYCTSQIQRSLSQLRDDNGHIDFTQAPRNIGPDEHRWNLRSIKTPEEWTAGFWPGILWMGSQYAPQSEHSAIRQAAVGYTAELRYLAYSPVYDHDLGFIMIGSYLKGLEAMQTSGQLPDATCDDYRHVLLAAADTLATLYNPRVGTLLSWPRNVAMFGGHNTIMDNMINLELLFWASQHNPDHAAARRLYDIAVSHADTTMRYHFRPDHSINHVAVYDPISGRHLRNCNHQGLNDSSLWSRGQSWAIYGYTMMYRYTHETRYLDFAQQVTDVMLAQLPADGIPYWDMRDPLIPHAYRDASAAAIIADALIELSDYVPAPKARRYTKQALRMLRTLSSAPYLSGDDAPSFLRHSVGNMPAHSEIDYSISYADYYYLEALLRLKAKTAP